MTKLKTIAAMTLLTAFTVGCILAAFMILFGTYGQIEMKLLFSAVATGCYALLTLVLTTQKKGVPIEKKQHLGLATSALGLLTALVFIWDILGIQNLSLELMGKILMLFFLVSVVLTYAHLFSFVKAVTQQQKTVQLLTKSALWVLTIMMLVVLLLPLTVEYGDIYFVIAGILAFIVAMGGCAVYLMSGKDRAKIWQELQ